MTIHYVGAYLIALVGLVVGAAAGVAVGATREGTLARWDGRLTLPLLLGAAGAHLALIGAVEPLRQTLFGLYGLALLAVVGVAAMGWSIWRLGGTVLPAGSIAAYFYFAIPAHQADYVGLLVKLVELAAIAAVVAPVFTRRGRRPHHVAA
jgi:hypothetical protein